MHYEPPEIARPVFPNPCALTDPAVLWTGTDPPVAAGEYLGELGEAKPRPEMGGRL